MSLILYPSLRRGLLIGGLITALLTAASMFFVDVPLALFFNSYRQTAWADFFAFITDFANGAIWYSLAVLAIGAAYLKYKRGPDADDLKFKQRARAWAFMIVTMMTSGIFINAVKLMVGRERPRFLFRDGSAEFHPFGLRLADCAFPSGHTQSIWTAMLCLSLLFPKWRAPFLAVAATIGASRVIIGAHYLADVIASIYIAFAFTLLWRSWFEKDGISVRLGAGPN